MSDENDLANTIATNAAGPAEARGDSSSVRQHSLPDQIAADQHLSKKAAASSAGKGIHYRRNKMPGPI